MKNYEVDAYELLKSEAEKPAKERMAIIKTKKGDKIPRRYHLNEIELNDFLSKWDNTNIMPNPYKREGTYFAFVQALINLGINKKFSFLEVKNEMQNIMTNLKDEDKGNRWIKFTSKKPKNILYSKDVNGKIQEIAKMLQRLTGRHVYGEKLRQLHSCVDILQGDNFMPYYVLNTQFLSSKEVSPKNEFKNTIKRGRKKKIKLEEIEF